MAGPREEGKFLMNGVSGVQHANCMWDAQRPQLCICVFGFRYFIDISFGVPLSSRPGSVYDVALSCKLRWQMLQANVLRATGMVIPNRPWVVGEHCGGFGVGEPQHWV